jgi:hypothetical protein
MSDKITVIDPWDDTPPRDPLIDKVAPDAPQPEAGDLYAHFPDEGGPLKSKPSESPPPPVEYMPRPPETAESDVESGVPGLQRKENARPKPPSKIQEEPVDVDLEVDDAGDQIRALAAEGRLDDIVAMVEGLARTNAKLMQMTAPVYVDGKLVKDRFREMLARAPISHRYALAELRSENDRLREERDQLRADLAVARRDARRRA